MNTFVHGKTASAMRAAFTRARSWLLFHARALKWLKLEVWSVEGEERSTGEPLTVLCAAADHNKSYLLGLMFSAIHRERALGSFWLWQLARLGRAASSPPALICVEVYRFHRWLLRTRDEFYVPTWVMGEVALPCSQATMNNPGVKSDLRRMRRAGLRYEVTRDPAHLDDFYRNMYVPHVTSRHGTKAFVTTRAQVGALWAQCELLVITKSGERIAGKLILYEEAGPRFWLGGVRDGDPQHLRDGAIAATNYFALEYLTRKGYTKARLGLSRTFLGDGVLQYKRKWGQRIVRTTQDGFAIQVVQWTPAVRGFFEHNPFIWERAGETLAVVFRNTGPEMMSAELEQLERALFIPGLSTLVIRPPRQMSTCKPERRAGMLFERIEQWHLEREHVGK